MFEKMAYVIVLMQLPIYIAQKDAIGGLHWDQSLKGIIFFWWALTQNIIPIFSGGFADRYGYKQTLYTSMFFIFIAYLILGTQDGYYPFLLGAITLGFGSGLFKPAIQGAISKALNEKKQSIGWGIYFMLLNLAVFLGYTLSKYLKSFSWEVVFFGSALITLINFALLLPYSDIGSNKVISKESPIAIFKKTFVTLINSHLLLFVLFMSGFTIIYMQFYETLPNFLVDWTDTSSIIRILHLPKYMTMETARGLMISYEWLYNINSFLIIAAVVFIAWIFSRIRKIYSIITGILLATMGLLVCGSTINGWFAVFGIIVYTFGEMITNPKFAEYLSSIAPDEEKGLFMGYISISLAIGLGGGSLAGVYLYQHYAEKAGLAFRYLNEHGMMNPGVTVKTALIYLQNSTGLNSTDATKLLWNTYNPYTVWYPFVIVGILSIIGLFFYSKKYPE